MWIALFTVTLALAICFGVTAMLLQLESRSCHFLEKSRGAW